MPGPALVVPAAIGAGEVAITAAVGVLIAWKAYRSATTDADRTAATQAALDSLARLKDPNAYKEAISDLWDKTKMSFQLANATMSIGTKMLMAKVAEETAVGQKAVDEFFWRTIKKNYPEGGGGGDGQPPNGNGSLISAAITIALGVAAKKGIDLFSHSEPSTKTVVGPPGGGKIFLF